MLSPAEYLDHLQAAAGIAGIAVPAFRLPEDRDVVRRASPHAVPLPRLAQALPRGEGVRIEAAGHTVPGDNP